jgi:ubiquitin thioesterase protein OTUB1
MQDETSTEESIRRDFASQFPLISPLYPLASPQITSHYGPLNLTDLPVSQVRIIRPDGNCFYRAYSYRLLELVALGLLGRQEVFDHFSRLNSSLVARFYPGDLVSDFFDVFVELLDRAASASFSLEAISHEDSLYMITFFRFLTGAALRADAAAYAAFIDGDVDAFCRAEVDVVNRECDAVQISALAAVAEISVNIFYLQLNRPANQVHFPDPPPPDRPLVNLLYKPGHYDLAYLS